MAARERIKGKTSPKAPESTAKAAEEGKVLLDPLKRQVSELECEVEKRGKEFDELKVLLQTVQADFENAMKRRDKETAVKEDRAKATVLASFLPVLDSMQEALKKLPSDKGLKLLHEQFWNAFQKNGVSEIKCVNFDPNCMECVLKENMPGKKDHEVLEECQKGYMFNGLVLRPAKVKINVLEEKKEEIGEKKEGGMK
ncbi:MAG: nucleotide exchange factor GrpE [Candidatus Diapherotrites archaeon]|nr:nucleotide exchange factor GrpE [Candidatus Diapherotrites archaeon]